MEYATNDMRIRDQRYATSNIRRNKPMMIHPVLCFRGGLDEISVYSKSLLHIPASASPPPSLPLPSLSPFFSLACLFLLLLRVYLVCAFPLRSASLYIVCEVCFSVWHVLSSVLLLLLVLSLNSIQPVYYCTVLKARWKRYCSILHTQNQNSRVCVTRKSHVFEPIHIEIISAA